MKLLVKAIISILLLSFTVGLYLGGKIVITITIFTFSLVCLYEFFSILEVKKIYPYRWIGYLGTVLIYYFAYCNNFEGLALSIGGISILLFIFLIFFSSSSLEKIITGVTSTVFGIIYIPFLFSFLVLVCNLHYGLKLFLLIILANGIGDMSANGIGRWFGKHKICPKISFSKTLEGTITELVAAVIVTLLIGKWFVNLPFSLTLPLGVVIGIFSVIGDFMESLLKRSIGVKDTGNWLPEHGGLLDRCDSVITASFGAYLFLTLVLK